MKNDRITMVAPVAATEAVQPITKVTGFGLPLDLQEKACRRVAQFALLMTGIVLFIFLSSRPVWQDFTPGCSILIARIMQGVILVFSAGLFLIARSRRLSHSFILKTGLVYEVLFCLAVGIGYSWFTASAYGIFAAITLATLVIAVYPMIVPSPPLKTLMVALLSAAAAPLGVFVVSLLEVTEVGAADYWGVSLYPLVCVALAYFGSRIIYGLNLEVAEARELGSYQLNRLLGKGGMGEVWRATHRLLARPAAVKLVRTDAREDHVSGTGGNTKQRFEREAQVTASLQSPHTVDLFDFGRTDQGAYYYVMELLDGLDLDSMVSRYGPLPPERTVYLMRQACLSLAEAHDKGLVHRDIKPANILLCRYGRDYDFIKVLDFGMVALQSHPQGADSKLTTEGFAGGTPAYMPPEVSEGTQVDGRTDIYALGCVAYWLLTGRTVFEADSPMAVILAHMKDSPIPPSQVAEMDIPPDLEEIVLSCLEKDPEKRPQDADSLLSRLEACSLEKPWTGARARQWWDTVRPKTQAQESEDPVT